MTNHILAKSIKTIIYTYIQIHLTLPHNTLSDKSASLDADAKLAILMKKYSFLSLCWQKISFNHYIEMLAIYTIAYANNIMRYVLFHLRIVIYRYIQYTIKRHYIIVVAKRGLITSIS